MTSSKQQSVSIDNLTYEEALAELENIVAVLEAEKRALDESLALYERGQALARFCTSLLEQAELKVQALSGDTLIEFNLPD